MRFLKALRFVFPVFLTVSFATNIASAQTTLGYRQKDLTCSVECSAPNQSAFLVHPWGIAFLQGQNFFITENSLGRVDSYDSSGQLASGLSLPLPTGSTALNTRPTGIVADPESNFVLGTSRFQFFAATEEGTIVGFSIDNGQPVGARVVVDHSANSAVYTGITLLHPSCCNPKLAVANFHDGNIEVYGLAATALPGAFEDPSLPIGYAPYNIQTVGDQVFVTYAKQDESRHAPVVGDGLGIVSIFDQEGNFVRRFVSDGEKLNSPWGVTQTSRNFGPFPNRILIGNVGDARIGVYDPATGEFLGPLADSEQKLIANNGLRALMFRNDGVGDPDNLYFVAGPTVNGVDSGLFATVGVGRLTTTVLFATEGVVGVEASLVAQVTPVAGGDTATGRVDFFDDGVRIDFDGLVGGLAAIFPIFTRTGTHTITAEYQGTDNLLPSIDQKQITILGPPTTTTLTVDLPSAGVGVPVTFTASTQSANGVPTGNVKFKEGSAILGTAPVDATGKARLTLTSLTSGVHPVFASYDGTDDFQGSSSLPILVSIGGDFQFTPGVPAITVPRGRSADVTLTVSPSGGFAGQVSFNCVAPAGITCAFTPSTLNVNGSPASTRFTVTASSTIARNSHGLNFACVALGVFGTLLVGRHATHAKSAMIVMAVLAFGLLLVACGGSGKQSSGTPPQVLPLTLSATGGSISHSTTISVTVQ